MTRKKTIGLMLWIFSLLLLIPIISFAAAKLSITKVEANKTSTTIGNAIVWVVSAKDGSGKKEYRFDVYKDSDLLKKGSYGSGKQFKYTPTTAGKYKVCVYVKDGTGKASKYSNEVVVKTTLTITSIKANVTSILVNKPITWTISAKSGNGTKTYRFDIYKDNALLKKGSFSSSKQFVYTPKLAGVYKVLAYVKDRTGTVSKYSNGITVNTSSTPAVTMTISGHTYPTGTLMMGSPFGLRGIVNSNYTLSSVTAGVYQQSNGGETSQIKTVYPNAKSYDLYGVINDSIIFNDLTPGDYTYKVMASSNGTTKTLVSSNFSVVPAVNMSISGQTYPTGTLAQGSPFGLKGIVNSDYILTSVTAGVYYQSNGNETNQVKTVYPNAMSCDIKATIDAFIIFNDLAPGDYIYKVMATSNGVTATLLSSNFSVVGFSFSYPVPGYAFACGLYCNCSVHNGKHNGGDIPTGGTKPTIYSVHSGVVTIISQCPIEKEANGNCSVCHGRGNCIRIDGNGVSTVYMHMSSISVSNGQSVAQGQAVGKVGTTGWSTGPHLHLELRIGGVLKNPKDYIK